MKRAALVQRPVARRHAVPLLRGRQLSRLFDGDRADAQHHAAAAGFVRRRRRRPQHRQAADRRRSAGRATARRCCCRDNWDIWQVPVAGGAAVNLTVNGRKDSIRYQHRYPLEPIAGARAAASTSRSRSTSARTASGRRRPASRGSSRASPASKMLTWADASFAALTKAREGRPVHLHARDVDRAQRTTTSPTRRSRTGERLTDQRPQVASVRVVRGRAARQLHERQGRQAAGGAVPARQLREGQGVPDDRQHLREAVADGEPVRQSDGERLQPLRLHEQRLRGAAAGHHLPRQRSRHVGGVVHGARRSRPRSRPASSIRRRSASPATRGAATRRRS